MDWAQYDLATIVAEIHAWLVAEKLDIPLIPAGGIFTGSDAVSFLENGAAAVQVATGFTVAPRMRPARKRSSRNTSGQRGRNRRQSDLAHGLSRCGC